MIPSIITASTLSSWSKGGIPDDDERVGEVVAAVNAYVSGTPVMDGVELPELEVDNVPQAYPAMAQMGALMLAARVWRRRNSPAGIESVDGTIRYVSRYDPDVTRMLRLDAPKAR